MDEFLIPIAFFAMVFGIVYIAIRRKERQALIDAGLSAEIFYHKGKSNSGLKWGLFLTGAGLGLLLANIMVEARVMEEGAAYFSMVFLFGGISLIISHFLVKKKEEEEKEDIEK